MKRQRFLVLFVPIVCVGLGWGILDSRWAPMAGPVAAQTHVWTNDDAALLPPASASVRHAAATAINAQLAAFRADNYQAAIKYQSARLKRHFRSVKQFREMITNTYPEFAHSKSIEFKDARADGKGHHVVMRITLVGQDGVTVNAVYLLVKENGQYRVAGVGGGIHEPFDARTGPGVNV